MTYSVGQHPKIDDFRGSSTPRIMSNHRLRQEWRNSGLREKSTVGQHSCLSIDVDVVPQFVGQHRENTDFCLSSHANHHANLHIRILGSFHGWKDPNTMRSNADYQSRPSWSLPPGMASSRSRVYCFCGWSKTSSVVACSTSLPCCITTTSSAIWRTTARSWVMNR